MKNIFEEYGMAVCEVALGLGFIAAIMAFIVAISV